MPNLGDYLGHLVSEITIARMQADLEAVRVAELYASHPLLRHMTVPRFTLPTVQLDVPVVINTMQEPRPGESPRGGVDITKLQTSFDDLMDKRFRQESIKLSAAEQRKIRESLDELLGVFKRRPAETAIDVKTLAKAMTKAVFTALQDPARSGGEITPERVVKLATELEELATIEFLTHRTAPPRLGVMVTTQEVREAGTEGITQIRLTISEHAVEWTRIDSDGEHQDRLVPE